MHGRQNVEKTLIIVKRVVFIRLSYIMCKGKGKSVPFQAWTGQEGSDEIVSQIS